MTAPGTLGGPLSCGLDLSVVNDGTIEFTAGGSGTFHFEYCVTKFDPAVVDSPVYDGVFSIVTGTTTITGTMDGSSQVEVPTPDGFPIHLDLTATVSATGTLVFDGFLGPAASTVDGALSGTVVVSDDAEPPPSPPPTEPAPSEPPPTEAPTTEASPTEGPDVGDNVADTTPDPPRVDAAPAPAAAPVSGSPTFAG